MSDFETLVTQSLNFDPTIVVEEGETKEVVEEKQDQRREARRYSDEEVDVRQNRIENFEQKSELKIEFLTPQRPVNKNNLVKYTPRDDIIMLGYRRHIFPCLTCLVIYLLLSFDKMCVFICATMMARFFANNITLRC